jgi:hypothetical protein
MQNRVSFVKYNTGCKAWQNVMLAGINAGVSHGAFSADPGMIREGTFEFSLNHLPALAHVGKIGPAEFRLAVLVCPTEYGVESLRSGSSSGMNYNFMSGKACARGTFDQCQDRFISTSAAEFSCKLSLRQILALPAVSDYVNLPC